MAAETNRERDGGSDGDRMGGTALRIWINLTLCVMSVCVLGACRLVEFN